MINHKQNVANTGLFTHTIYLPTNNVFTNFTQFILNKA